MQQGEPSSKLESAQGIVEQLRVSRQDLTDDLQNKTATLKIAVLCRRCTPATTKVPLSKTSAIQYAAGTGKLKNSSSTPCLNGANGKPLPAAASIGNPDSRPTTPGAS